MQVIARKEALSKDLKRYYTGKPCKHGHITERLTINGSCCTCALEKNRKRLAANPDYWREYKKQYRQKNLEKERQREAEWREKNRKKISENLRRYRQENNEAVRVNEKRYRAENAEKIREDGRRQYEARKDHYRAMAKKYAARHPDKMSQRNRAYREKNRDKLRQYHRDRYQKPEVKLAYFIRGCVTRTVHNKDAPSFELIGYTPEQLRTHLEKQFVKGMSWDNHGTAWHIDHITPISKLIAEGETDPAVINCLSNLQPLWATENMSKSNRITTLL